MRMSSFLVAAALLAVLAAATRTAALDEDLGFDVSDDFEVEIDDDPRKLWQDREITASVGKVFHLVVPKENVGRDVRSYEVHRSGDTPLPLWLLFDKLGGVFWGVPLAEDVATLHLVIRAIGSDKNVSEEVTITVAETSDLADKCPSTEDNTLLTLLIDKGVRAIKPKQRVIAINNIAKFFGLPYSAFTLKPQLEKDDITDSSVVLAGPGNLHSRTSKLTSYLQVPVGCDGRLWLQTAPLVHQLKQQARDGTIAEVLGLPVIGWRVKTETKPVVRSKRQTDDYGSGDYDDYYDDNYDDEYDEGEDEIVPNITTPTTTTSNQSPTHPHRHHHGEDPEVSGPVIRDHHHQSSSPKVELETIPITLPIIPSTTTTTTTTEKPTTREEVKIAASPSTDKTTNTIETSSQTGEIKPSNPVYDYDYEEYDDMEEDDDDGPVESKTIIPEVLIPNKQTPEVTTTNETASTTSTSMKPGTSGTKDFIIVETQPTTLPPDAETTFMIVEDTEPPTETITETIGVTSPPMTSTQSVPATVVTVAATTTSTTTTPEPVVVVPTTTEKVPTTEEEETSTIKLTTARHIISTTATHTDEIVEYGTKNFQPYIENRLKQMSVIAGKIFRFVVPENTFSDLEDGYNLSLEFLNGKGEQLSQDSWCHFNPMRREIYGLPLEEDVSKWEYVIRATDRDGASVDEMFTIQVQQHKSQRVVNHEFSLYLRIEKRQEFPHFVDWCLKTLRALGRLYNTNMTEITVRNINYTSDPVIFTWTNDSIPTNDCPADEIDKLYRELTANERGDPSQKLSTYLAPELRVKKVLKHGLGVCEEAPPVPPVTPPTNFPPFLRNPVDQINATVGELLIFRVPDDTFYDPEDTDSRTLNISLLTGDRQPIRPNNWLQFDGKNREFYGIPRKSGRSEYQLVCVDSAGLPATDSLEIVVFAAPKTHYNVEFSMTIETPYDAFVNSAAMQRKFVEKLQEIFEDRNASFIHLNPFKMHTQDSTTVTWYNKSLSTAKCPHEEINRLEGIMKNHDLSISNRVFLIMEPEFAVSTIKVLPTGNCRTKTYVPPPTPDDAVAVPDEKSPEVPPDDYQYLMTFIVPAVIISIMLLLASVAACVLYRRRRMGKMNVEEDGRQSYGNKGIPVIFQEELEEKPESGTKTPVILKDEKPPLAPPEYSKSGSLKLTDDSEPYQPPPPFTRTQDNGRQPRPKPTPTYRKPPPYVPP